MAGAGLPEDALAAGSVWEAAHRASSSRVHREGPGPTCTPDLHPTYLLKQEEEAGPTPIPVPH